MLTNYGEIQSIEDLFETTNEVIPEDLDVEEHIRIIYEEVKCKLCGDLFKVQSSRGAVYSGSDGDPNPQLKKHIELHKTLKVLGIY
jgi:hypothetical protein